MFARRGSTYNGHWCLDPFAARQVQDLIIDYVRLGRTVLLCTHDLEEAERLCDRVAVLEHGRVIAIGGPVELAQTVPSQSVEIEVEPGAAQRARDLIRESLIGVHVTVNDTVLEVDGVSRSQIPALVGTLCSAEIPVS